MAYIGMRHLVAAPVTSHTDGSAITYGAGFVIGPAVAATLNYIINDNPDYGDDVEQDNDNGINGYSGPIDATDIEDEVMAKLLGWETIGTGENAEYEASASEPPKMGWGFVRVKMKNGVRKYEAKWFHKAQFTQPTITGTTKARQIEWNHPQLNVSGIGAYIDATGKVRWFRHKTFTTEAAATAWLDGKANITSTPVTT